MPRQDKMVASAEHPSHAQLQAFSSGQLSGAAMVSIARHIKECEACCQVLREIPDDALVVRLRGAAKSTAELAPKAQALLPQELLEHARYKIGRFLGAGGMGAVFLAEHRMMGRLVALKIIHRTLTNHARVIQRFRQEVKAAAKLSHPNIVAAYDADQAGDAHFLVMEFVDGVSLDRLVASKGPLDVVLACNLARQAARGLQHAFEMGMVHRDIKPHNLMLTRKGEVKILDFGLARLASETRAARVPVDRNVRADLTRLGEIMGTPDYMAPEQIASPHAADIRADLYSLGCTLYFLLTGEPPFAGDSAAEVLHSQQYRVPQPLSDWRDDVPAELIAVVNAMLAKQPGDRYQTPAEVAKALTPLLRMSAVEAPMPAVAALEAAAPRPKAPVARLEPHTFAAHCPFCTTPLRLPDKALGVSIPCPHCSCYFTAVPEDE